jgi:hypothetical protein
MRMIAGSARATTTLFKFTHPSSHQNGTQSWKSLPCNAIDSCLRQELDPDYTMQGDVGAVRADAGKWSCGMT